MRPVLPVPSPRGHGLRDLLTCLASLVLASTVASAQTRVAPRASASSKPSVAKPAGDPAAGQRKADEERCIECHGTVGQGGGQGPGHAGKFAKLMGQHPEYLLKQLEDFRTARRKHDVMQMMARSVDPSDLRDIVAYFSSQPRMQGDANSNRPAARKLYTEGDPARQLAACSSCHGAAGAPSSTGGPWVPLLSGQEPHYLEDQLIAFKRGLRNNSADGAMNKIAQALSDAEITEIAGYLAGRHDPP